MIGIKDIREEDLNTCYRAFAKVIGLEATLKLGKELGGEYFVLPKLKGTRNLTTLAELVSLNKKYRDIAKVIGLEATLRLSKELGGEYFYLNKPDGPRGILSRARDRIIIEELKTHSGSIVHLARKYNITSRCIYDIIKRAKEPGQHKEGECSPRG